MVLDDPHALKINRRGDGGLLEALRRAGGIVGVLGGGIAGLLAVILPFCAFGQGAAERDPFAESQLEQVAVSSAPGGTVFTVSGFVDTGYIHIAQSGAEGAGSDISWAYGNSQFGFSSETDTFTVNEVDLTLRAERARDGSEIGAVASVDFYPSRDTETYASTETDREFQVDQAYVWITWPGAWDTRIRLGRVPGIVTLEQQQESEAPDSRLIGHTYVFQAGGGYPFGPQVRVRPLSALTVQLGQSNGGVGDYTFFPGDRGTANRSVAPDKDHPDDPTDKLEDKTLYGSVDWVVFDEAAGSGRLQLGGAYAGNPGLTYNPNKNRAEPYTFSDVWLAYKVSDYEARLEVASLSAYYSNSIGLFEAGMTSLLLSYELGARHLFTLRYETIDYVSDVNAGEKGQATKYGLTYRLRISDPMVLKLEFVTETQSPQFWTMDGDLATDVAALSWVYSF
jgi:hypothetical protein